MKNIRKRKIERILALTIAIMIVIVVILSCVGCAESQSERVSYNISQEADNFNVTRRLAVINARTDKPVFEMIGNFSLSNNSSNELEITVETEKGVYKKHFIYLNDWTMYVVEDISGAYVNKYKYQINFLPEMIQPITVTKND